ncbi:MAG: polysaccharide biosynthesis/export family protein, partial [bacterium]|nr:polysaccharide biosynthesis/export family protein [bacterium]
MQKRPFFSSIIFIFILILVATGYAEQGYPFGPQPTQTISPPPYSPYSVSTGAPLTSFPYSALPYGAATGVAPIIVPPGYFGTATTMLPTFGMGTLLPMQFLPGITIATATAIPPQEVSDIEKIYAGEFPTGISTEIKQFGYDAFQETVSTFAPVLDVPVNEDYLIGPGDSFRITLWGKINVTYPAVVDRNGEISIPEIGVLKVWGLTYGELKKYLNHEIKKYYTDFEMAVTMERIKTIRVYIVGAARYPGSYTLSSLATLFNALFAAGGPSKSGTMRNIQLIRNGKVVQEADLYEFLLQGDRTADVRLENQDTIFIPVIGKVAGIAGHIKCPAIYELKEKLDLAGLIKLAGGITAVGYLERVQVERMEANQKRVVVDFNLAGMEIAVDKPE